MTFDLRTVPLSRYGSYLCFSWLPARPESDEGLYLRTVHAGGTVRDRLARIELVREGVSVPFTIEAMPTLLRLRAEPGLAEICFATPTTLRLRTQGVGLRLNAPPGDYVHIFGAGEDRWQLTCFPSINLMLSPLSGSAWQVDAPFREDRCCRIWADLKPPPGEQAAEGAITEFASTWLPEPAGDSFEACLAGVERDFQRWLARTLPLPEEFAAARELAAYINWSAVVSPLGLLKRPAMFMSKNWMLNVWSWDHCFNALALAAGDPDLAWDQFLVMFDQQDASGALPDSINDRRIVWNFCKPPIHGWTLLKLLQQPALSTPARLLEVYEPLRRWTEWWLNYRDWDGDGIPQYHHGNDSGWDNATPFEAGLPLEAPDLSAFLVLQMEALAEVATRLGRRSDAQLWEQRGAQLLARLLDHLWRGDRFVALRSGDHAGPAAGDSLFLYLPLLLGRRLPERVRTALIAGLLRPGRFLTEHGLATESPQSPLYVPDGYWRGPIWAPSTMLLVDGLAACGELDAARDIARRFCRMAARSGMAENYNALTGAGLRDRAYTWTSSVFLLLGSEYGAS